MGSVTHRVGLVVAALAAACAATLPARTEAPPPPADTAPPAAALDPAPDAQAMPGVARFVGAFEPLAPAFVDLVVRWQIGVRDVGRSLEERLAALVDSAGIAVPDLTVLSIEPVANTESSGFGWRDDPIRHTRRFHTGTDFRGKPGTPVSAAGDGIVTFSGRLGGYGNIIDIDHGGGLKTRYAHLRRLVAAKHTTVTAGQTIGQLGSTGRATGPHLHFEVRLDGSPVSPIAALAIAALQRESPLAGRLAALALSPDLQSLAESDIDPPRRAKGQRPERPGRARRRQVLW